MQIPESQRRRRGSVAVDVLLWVAALGTVAATIAYSLGPAPAELNAFPLADKVFHMGAYAAMTLTWLLAAVWRPGRGPGPAANQALAIIVCAVLFGAAIEVAQHFVDRTADVFDAVADAIGAGVGFLAWAGLRTVAGGTPRA
jgi:VanZ family protein